MDDDDHHHHDQDHGILTGLPVGYRFLPTDEELVTHYLMNKVFYRPLPDHVIQEIDASDLYSKPPNKLVTFSCGEREWYFFVHAAENFIRENEGDRIVGNGIGFWKSSGQEKLIFNSDGNDVAFKFHFTYFSGSFPNAKKTHWKMQEYRLPFKGKEWVLGRLKRGMDYNGYSSFL